MLLHFESPVEKGRTSCKIRLIFVKVAESVDKVTCSSCKETYEYNSARFGRN